MPLKKWYYDAVKDPRPTRPLRSEISTQQQGSSCARSEPIRVPQDCRTISLVGIRIRSGARRGLSMRRNNSWAAASPNCRADVDMVVRGGSPSVASGTSSTPVTAISTPARSPRDFSPTMKPKATISFAQTAAVGGSGPSNSRSTASKPACRVGGTFRIRSSRKRCRCIAFIKPARRARSHRMRLIAAYKCYSMMAEADQMLGHLLKSEFEVWTDKVAFIGRDEAQRLDACHPGLAKL